MIKVCKIAFMHWNRWAIYKISIFFHEGSATSMELETWARCGRGLVSDRPHTRMGIWGLGTRLGYEARAELDY